MHDQAGKIVVACINSSENITISGDISGVNALEVCFQIERIFARKLQTRGRAYHSHHMVPLRDEYERLI